jgi:type II secretory pathway pseudopilin PulG
MNNVIRKRNRQGGFSFMELMIALIIFIVAVALIILATQGFFTRAKGTTMGVDIHSVKSGVDNYAIQSGGQFPTTTGLLPPQGRTAEIDFTAYFIDRDGKKWTFYPQFITKLPRHWAEGVWLIDSAALVSVNMNPDDY